MAPAAALLYVGLARLVPSALAPVWPALLIALLAAMDVSGLITVLVPAYLA
jgi:hypothetical protein